MDHMWDGFYSGQVRMQRYHGLVWAPTKSVYDVVYTGSPAKKQGYMFQSLDPKASLTVRIAYPGAESR